MRNPSILQENCDNSGSFHHELLESTICSKNLVLVSLFFIIIYIHIFLVRFILGSIELLFIEDDILLYGKDQ